MSDRTDAPTRLLVLAHHRLRDELPQDVHKRITTRLIGRTEDVEDAIESFEPQVVLIDTTFPDGEAFTAIERVTVQAPQIPVLALTPTPPPHAQVALATRAGASGFIDEKAEPTTFVAAIEAAERGETWFPSDETRRVLSSVADDLDTTSAERRSRFTGVILALVPLTGVIAALQAGFWRRYVGRIGVRPVDLAVDPASRVIDVLVAMLLVLGVFGPLLLVGNWLDMLQDSRFNRGFIAKLLQRRIAAHLLLSALWLILAAAIAIGPDLALVAVVGPIVALSILGKAVGANEELPRLIRIEGISLPAAIVGSLVVVLAFMGVLTYEVFVVGPDLRTDGEHGFIAPRILGMNATPVRAYNVDTDEVSEVLYLGGNADLYVLVDVCQGNRVDYVSVGAHRLVVIDEVTCPPDTAGE